MIGDNLIAANGGRRGRLAHGLIVVEGHAGDERSDPPRLPEKSDQAVPTAQVYDSGKLPARWAPARRHYARWKVSEGLWEKARAIRLGIHQAHKW